MNADSTTADTRLADWPMQFNPAITQALVELACGGHRIEGNVDRLFGLLHARLRYFDPERRRAGLPEGVSALITSMTPDTVKLTLVNVNQLSPRAVIVQGGAYGEHQIREVTAAAKVTAVNARHFTVLLAPGAGAELLIRDARYANRPTLAMPWFGKASPAVWQK